MPKHKRHPEEIEETTVTRRVKITKKTPVAKWIRDYLEEQDPTHMEELASLEYVIKAQRKERDRWVTSTRTYDNLATLPQLLAERYGSGIFRLWITATDEHGHETFLKIQDYAIEGEEVGAVEDEPGDDLDVVQLKLQWEREKLEKEQQHAERMKMFDTLANQKQQNLPIASLMNMLKTGIKIGSGNPPTDDGEGGDDIEQEDVLSKSLSALGEGAMRALLQKIPSLGGVAALPENTIATSKPPGDGEG